MGYCPRLTIQHTSERADRPDLRAVHQLDAADRGDRCWCVGFRSSDNLGGAYGIAVTLAMLIDSILIFVVMRRHLGLAAVGRARDRRCRCSLIDLAFLASNSLKIPDGGWFPLAHRRRRVHAADDVEARPRAADASACPKTRCRSTSSSRASRRRPPTRVAGHGRVPDVDAGPRAARAAAQPEAQQGAARARRVPDDRHARHSVRARRGARCESSRSAATSIRSSAYYGFKEDPDVPELLEDCGKQRLRVRHDGDVVLRLARDADRDRVARHGAVARAAVRVDVEERDRRRPTSSRCPTNRVVELGTQVEL